MSLDFSTIVHRLYLFGQPVLKRMDRIVDPPIERINLEL